MLIGQIRDFEWYNEPQDFNLIEEGLLITTAPKTDFWQNADCGFAKDDGHLFFQKKSGNLTLMVKWHFPQVKDSAQCGAMIRSDHQNWIKAGLLSQNPYNPQLGVVVASQGASDWSMIDLPKECKDLWVKIRRRGKDFIVWYAVDGENFKQIRMVHLSKTLPATDVGAYACSPKDEPFECLLEQIEITD